MRSQKPALYALMVAILAITSVVGISVASAQADPSTPTIQMTSNSQLGSFLADANGMTLYIFTKDTPGVSNCTGSCATLWPPLTVQQGETPSLATGIPGQLGVITRSDGSMQVIFNGMPLYTYSKDQKAGDTTGENVGSVWFVAAPATASLGSNSTLGQFLVGPNGMTLYTFKNDSMDTSTCTGACATLWPPLTVKQGETPSLQLGLSGKLGTITRSDGTIQVTYNGMPLYYYSADQKPGDATGQAFKDLWYVVQPTTLSLGNNSAVGQFLVGPNGMTLYTFKNDTTDTSTCTGACATLWPPLLVAKGQTPSFSSEVMGKVGVITRADGTMQVTYNGMPLYYYSKDIVPGDATGQAYKDLWYVATP
jgi:predicted lipoprotein with Yx(FWY)xxD motif